MKSIAVLLVIVAFAAVIVYADDEENEQYTSKYDNFDVDNVLKNDRLLKNYIACIDGTGKCTPEGEELKKRSKEILETCCEKCSVKQKEAIKKAHKYLQDNKPDILKQVTEKLDPTGEFAKKCEGKFDFTE